MEDNVQPTPTPQPEARQPEVSPTPAPQPEASPASASVPTPQPATSSTPGAQPVPSPIPAPTPAPASAPTPASQASGAVTNAQTPAPAAFTPASQAPGVAVSSVDKAANRATIALVLGIVSIVTCMAPILGIGLGVSAIIIANQWFKQFGKDGGGHPKTSHAKAGRICGFVGIGMSVVTFIAAVAIILMAAAITGDTSPDESETVQPIEEGVSGGSDDGSGGSEGGGSGDDDVIIAGGVDTSSKYSFSVETAVVGVDEYSEIPEVILLCEFTNNSDDVVSFSSALGAEAFQDGYALSTAYLSGASSFNYESIAPGKSIPVFIAWELLDGTSDVEITVYDQYHYAKEVVFEGSWTIDELIANSEAFANELEGIIDEEQEIAA